jgi:hypothetical protein
MGPVIIAESVGAIRSVDSGDESGVCGDASGMANAPDDAGASCACSNVARPRDEASEARDGADGVEIVEAAVAELDAGRTEAAKARLKALVAAIRSARRA